MVVNSEASEERESEQAGQSRGGYPAMQPSDGLADANNMDVQRDRVLATMMSMYLEQSTAARHQETQRSTVSTILVSLSAALVGVVGALWSKAPADFAPPISALPLTISLTLLGVFGFFISGKLFERSMVNFHLSEAYLNTIDALVADDVRQLLPPSSVTKLQYVRDAKRLALKSRGMLQPRQGPPVNVRLRIKSYHPVNPRPVVVPAHDVVETGTHIAWPEIDLFRLWARLYTGIAMGGIALTALAVFPYAGAHTVLGLLVGIEVPLIALEVRRRRRQREEDAARKKTDEEGSGRNRK